MPQDDIYEATCEICGKKIRAINEGLVKSLMNRHKHFKHGNPKVIEVKV